MNETYKIQKELLDLSNIKLNITKGKRENATPEQLQKLKVVGFNSQTVYVDDTILKYPLLKIIHSSAIKEICKKYNLVFGDIDSFIGDVPKKNAAELLTNHNYILKKKPDYFEIFKYNRWGYCGITSHSEFIKKYGEDKFNDLIDKNVLNIGDWRKTNFDIRLSRWDIKVKIIAPLTDFDVSDKKLKGYKLITKDPIVLMKVASKMWAVLTAWGPEAQDANVFNENLN